MALTSTPAPSTPRLSLRPFAPTDLDALAAIYADPDVMQYVKGGVRTREQTAANIAVYGQEWRTQGHGVWAVTEAVTQRLLGMCGFVERAELGYILGRSCWGRGFATEAARGCLRCGFEQLGFDVIGAGALRTNRSSLRVLEKLGMTPTPNTYFDMNGGTYFTLAAAAFARRGQRSPASES